MRGKGKNNSKSNCKANTKKGNKPGVAEDRNNQKYSQRDTYVPGEGKGRESADYYKSGTNDWRWYANDPQLLRDVASMPFGYSLGSLLQLRDAGARNGRGIPGVMAINFVPGVGYSANNQSAVNIAMKNMVTYLKASVSGARTYDSPDLCMYLMAIDSANMFLAWMRRIYGVTGLANMLNRYYPEALLHANAVDFGEMRRHMADFRAYINIFATKLGGYVLPSFMPICARHMWLCNGYYEDNDSDKNQLYMFVPDGFHQFNLDSDGAGQLVYKPFIREALDADHYLTFDQITAFGDGLLELIRDSYGEQDFNQIAADLLAAYGEQNVYRPEGISDGYVVLPTYDPVVLGQIQNLTAFGIPNAKSCDIVQDPTKNFVMYTPNIPQNEANKHLSTRFTQDRMLLANMSNPGPETVIENSRLMFIPEYDSAAGLINPFNIGSEFCSAFTIYTFMKNEHGVMYLSHGPSLRTALMINTPFASDTPGDDIMETTLDEVNDLLTNIEEISNFDWHPICTVDLISTDLHNKNVLNTSKQSRGYLGDINNYTLITRHDLERLSHVALLSEFAVEKFGR